MFRDFNGILIDEIFLPYSGSFYLTQISEFLIHKVKDKYCPEGGGDPAGETGADSDSVCSVSVILCELCNRCSSVLSPNNKSHFPLNV